MTEKKESGHDLTALQKRACEEFIKDLRPMKAMVRAGYAESSANKNSGSFFESEDIQKYVRYLQNKTANKVGISAEEIVRRLIRISEKAERDDELPSAIRSLELLGKHLAMFTDKQIITDEKNPWATGDDQTAIEKDIKRLKKIAAPKLITVDGEEIDKLKTDEETDKAQNG